ncbi:hypothetical protein FF1_037430 [Malus domestica]
MRENRLWWFGHVKRRPSDAPVKRSDYEKKVQSRRGRGTPMKTLEETVRKDLDLTEYVAQNRAQWCSRIHTASPN